MTFEEFKDLALNPPKYKGNSILIVEKYLVIDPIGPLKSYYPVFNLCKSIEGYYTCLKNAEELIRDIVSKYRKPHSDLYCFYIKEFPVDKKLKWKADYGISMRLYDAGGGLVDQTHCSGLVSDRKNVYGEFCGRAEENIRFNPGDIVEVRIDDEVFLGIMCSDIIQ